MRKRSTSQDGQLLSQLGHLRNEPEMRAAHVWWRDQFWPHSAADYLKVEMAHDSDPSRWLRQVTTYWAMAASLVVDGTLSERAFFRLPFSQDVFTVFARTRPFLTELRKRTDKPDFMANVEEVILKTKTARKRLQLEEKRLAAFKKSQQ